MTTILFVHGTGVRVTANYDSVKETSLLISSKLQKHTKRSDLEVKPCLWGNELGANLHENGASIPQYDTTRSIETDTVENYNIALWNFLYQDPLYELRILSLVETEATEFVFGRTASFPIDQLDMYVQKLVMSDTSKLGVKLTEAGIADVFNNARLAVTSSSVYEDILQTEPKQVGEYREAIARAIVAEAIFLCEEQLRPAKIALDAKLRDEVVMLLISALGDTDRGIFSRIAKLVIANSLTTMYIRQRRGKTMDGLYPFPGDILLYQAHGEPIRQYIQTHIEQAAKDNPPVILLAHSLGGIASVDLLVLQEELRAQVKMLVTVGTQVPFLYEMGALYSLPFDSEILPTKRLPSDFPKWLNVYDPNDFLSYIGTKIFPGQVDDIRVNNRLPFPHSHSGYWNNDETWQAIVSNRTWKMLVPEEIV